MHPHHLRLEASPDDTIWIEAIVNRARKEIPGRFSHPLNRFRLTVDLTVCHTNGNPMRLEKLFDAPLAVFFSELIGIVSNLDRHTGLLKPSFTPSFGVSSLVVSQFEAETPVW